MAQVQKKIRVSDAIAVIDEWLKNEPFFYWSESPEWVKEQLRANEDEQGLITYHKASSILADAETTKMSGGANRGIGHFRSEWRKMYVI